MTGVWIVTALFGMAVVAAELKSGTGATSVDSLFGFVGLPMSGGIIGYLIKSAVENKEKIRANPDYLKNNRDESKGE